MPTTKKLANTLSVRNFAQIAKADIELGDLTLLVGAQATGKSLVAQMWKLGLDHHELADLFWSQGYDVDDANETLGVFFGSGMQRGWTSRTELWVNGKRFFPQAASEGKHIDEGHVYYVPAHRAMVMSGGWPAAFPRPDADTPAVVRMFSDRLNRFLRAANGGLQKSMERYLSKPLAKMVHDAILGSGDVEVAREQLRMSLRLKFGETDLPFMTWTAGQREAIPLLLDLLALHALAANQKKHPKIDWVVIEEPEMGLHPKAISTVVLLVLDLLHRGYRVILTTHSPLVLDIVFAARSMQEKRGRPEYLAEAFDVPNEATVRDLLRSALKKDYRTFALEFVRQKVYSKDISALDPFSEDPMQAGWAGLTGFSSRFGRAMGKAIDDQEG